MSRHYTGVSESRAKIRSRGGQNYLVVGVLRIRRSHLHRNGARPLRKPFIYAVNAESRALPRRHAIPRLGSETRARSRYPCCVFGPAGPKPVGQPRRSRELTRALVRSDDLPIAPKGFPPRASPRLPTRAIDIIAALPGIPPPNPRVCFLCQRPRIIDTSQFEPRRKKKKRGKREIILSVASEAPFLQSA